MVENKVSSVQEKDETKQEVLQPKSNDMDNNTDMRVYLTTFLMIAFVGVVILVKLMFIMFINDGSGAGEDNFTPLEQQKHSNFK